MGWLLVILAAIMEVVGVIGLKKLSRKKTPLNLLLMVGGFASAFALLYRSFHYVQMSVAYAVWVGLGTAAAVVVNMVFFGESRSRNRILSLLVIVIGISGLKAVS